MIADGLCELFRGIKKLLRRSAAAPFRPNVETLDFRRRRQIKGMESNAAGEPPRIVGQPETSSCGKIFAFEVREGLTLHDASSFVIFGDDSVRVPQFCQSGTFDLHTLAN